MLCEMNKKMLQGKKHVFRGKLDQILCLTMFLIMFSNPFFGLINLSTTHNMDGGR